MGRWNVFKCSSSDVLASVVIGGKSLEISSRYWHRLSVVFASYCAGVVVMLKCCCV